MFLTSWPLSFMKMPSNMPLGYELAILMEAGLAGYEMYKSALFINLQYASFRSTLSILCMYIALRVLTFPPSIITLGNALVFIM